METAIITSQVFSNLFQTKRLDEDILFSENESDTYATLRQIAEKIEDILFEMPEDERDNHGIEDIREWAEERILEAYGKTAKTYRITYSETYEDEYEVLATSAEDAKAKLLEDIKYGQREKPQTYDHCEVGEVI